MAMKTDSTHRYITSNNVPDFYVNPYCPIGLGKGYCVQQEIDAGTCFFTGLANSKICENISEYLH